MITSPLPVKAMTGAWGYREQRGYWETGREKKKKQRLYSRVLGKRNSIQFCLVVSSDFSVTGECLFWGNMKLRTGSDKMFPLRSTATHSLLFCCKMTHVTVKDYSGLISLTVEVMFWYILTGWKQPGSGVGKLLSLAGHSGVQKFDGGPGSDGVLCVLQKSFMHKG